MPPAESLSLGKLQGEERKSILQEVQKQAEAAALAAIGPGVMAFLEEEVTAKSGWGKREPRRVSEQQRIRYRTCSGNQWRNRTLCTSIDYRWVEGVQEGGHTMDELIRTPQSSTASHMNSQTTYFPFLGVGSQEGLEYRKRLRGMISVASKVPLKDRSVLSLVYTPGVAAPCMEIAKTPLTAFDYTLPGNTIALLSDGSSAFGFGNIGPLAALPLLEDTCILFKTFGGVDAFPICLGTQDVEEIIVASTAIWPTFGGFCLSSIASPRCFTITDHLTRAVNIPVLHAQQHANAVIILGALYNALKLVGKTKETVRVVINGAGPGGIGTALLLRQDGFQHILVCDHLGILYRYHLHNMDWAKLAIARQTNPTNVTGTSTPCPSGHAPEE